MGLCVNYREQRVGGETVFEAWDSLSHVLLPWMLIWSKDII